MSHCIISNNYKILFYKYYVYLIISLLLSEVQLFTIINNMAVNILIGNLCIHLLNSLKKESRNRISISSGMKYTRLHSSTCIECRQTPGVQKCWFLLFLQGHLKDTNLLSHSNFSIVFWYNCLSGISLFSFSLFKGSHFPFISL